MLIGNIFLNKKKMHEFFFYFMHIGNMFLKMAGII